MPHSFFQGALRATVALALLALGLPAVATPQQDDDLLFETQFDRPLTGWHLEPASSFVIIDSGDPEHGRVLELRPQTARTHALLPDSEDWGRYRIEGDVSFPTDEHNYLGFIYNLTRRDSGRIDLGSVYIKGNGSYIRANPRYDWNPLRMLYEEYRTPLTGEDSIVIGKWQRFAAEVVGNTFHLYVGDLEIPKITFDLYPETTGAAGFKPRVVGGPVWLDNLRATRISALSYRGPRQPDGIEYRPETLLTDWQVAGPFTKTQPQIENSVADPGAPQDPAPTWRDFPTDARGALISARVVDFLGPDSVAYFRTEVTTLSPSFFEISAIDDTAVWVDGQFRGYRSAQRFAWHDFGSNPEHAGRARLEIEPGQHTILVRVRGGRYAAGGFFARLAEDPSR